MKCYTNFVDKYFFFISLYFSNFQKIFYSVFINKYLVLFLF